MGTRWYVHFKRRLLGRQLPTDSAEEGNAVIEFIVGMVVLILPTLWLIMALASVQATVFAAESASREAARILAADVAHEPLARAQAAFAFSDYGLSEPTVVVSCGGVSCQDQDATISVTVTSTVRLPMIPDWSGLNTIIPIVSTTSTARDGVFFR